MAREEERMCPVCITTAVLISGGVTSTSVLAKIAIKIFGVKNAADDNPVPTPSKLYRESNGAGRNRPECRSKEKSKCQRA
jgi:hypothetical protein